MTISYYDDNFGHWDMDDDLKNNTEFYDYVQKKSVKKKCKRCERTVRILPDYAYCDPCSTAIEMGIDL